MNSDFTKSHPIFAITMGDPAGVGPEITLKAMKHYFEQDEFRLVILGDSNILKFYNKNFIDPKKIITISDLSEVKKGYVCVMDHHKITQSDFVPGQICAQCGAAAFAYIENAITLALENRIGAVITNPINKEALHLAGYKYPGHTEIFAEKTGSNHYSMVFYLENVGVAHVTTHCSLRTALNLITTERVIDHIKILNTALKRLGKKDPRIAVGGLNPHAGEHGIFGNEETEILEPAITSAQEFHIRVSGPYPPDTVFMRAFKGEFDGVVAMLHDHGFVALKSRNFDNGVNITFGLPIIRTSVGHGTAFDKAGCGTASETSLIEAIKTAALLYKHRDIS